MVDITLLSTLLMGLFLVVVFVAAGRIGTRSRVDAEEEHGSAAEALLDDLERGFSRLATDPGVWVALFVVAALAIGLLTVVAVGGFVEVNVVMAAAVLGLVFAAALAFFLFYGAYAAVRSRGLGNAQGVAAGIGILGLVLLLAIALQLIVGLV